MEDISYSGTLFFKESPVMFMVLTLGLFLSYVATSGPTARIAFTSIYSVTIGLLLYFYRVPILKEPTPLQKHDILSPCSGKVMFVKQLENYVHVAVFLSPLDIHLQYYPISGKVVESYHKKGQFAPAYLLEKSQFNERYHTKILPEAADAASSTCLPIEVVQYAGQLARRIVNYSKQGDLAKQGQVMGIIKLSSRVDIFVPKDAYNVIVSQGDRVEPVITTIATKRMQLASYPIMD